MITVRSQQSVTDCSYSDGSTNALVERLKLHTALAATLTKTLHTMLAHTSSEKGRAAVPLITNASGISPFPIQMSVKVGDVEVG